MSIFITKSEDSIKASNKLIQYSLFNPSVHCSYYSCVQLMLHLLRSHFGSTELQIDEERKLGSSKDHGFHNWLLNKIFVELETINSTDAAKFNTIINGLKSVRVKADYKKEEIVPKVAAKALSTSIKLNELLKENFQL